MAKGRKNASQTAKITEIVESAPSKAKGGKDASPSAVPFIVLGALSIAFGLAIHLTAVWNSPERSVSQLLELSTRQIKSRINVSHDWPDASTSAFLEAHVQTLFRAFLIAITVFKDLLRDDTGKALFLIITAVGAPMFNFAAVESLKHGRHPLLHITTYAVAATLGQVMCIGAATPLFYVPAYAYVRWSESKKPLSIHPLPSSNFANVFLAQLVGAATVATIIGTVFLPVESREWLLVNIAFQFFPLFLIPLAFASSRVKAAIDENGDVSKPRLATSESYRMMGYICLGLYYAGLYYGFQGFRRAYAARTFNNDAQWTIFWDLIGLLGSLYLFVLIDSFADEAAIKRGAQRVHARRFLPEDILMGLPGALLLGPGWAAATYWQRYVEAVVRVCGSAK